MRSTPTCLALAAVTAAILAVAQENPPPPDEILRRHDANHDHSISRDEAPDRMKRHFERIDRNGDGRIVEEELAAHEAMLNGTGSPPAGYTNKVTITTNATHRVIRANGIPNHTTGRFPNRRNPNAIREMDFTWTIPLTGKMAAQPIPTGINWFGVARNGVPLEPGTQEFYKEDRSSPWIYEAIGGTSDLGIDAHNAHVQPNGAYHYHALPVGLVDALGGDTNRMLLIGWAADGFPIYSGNGVEDPKDLNSPVRKLRASYRLKKDPRPEPPGGQPDGRFSLDFEYVKGLGDLDECNGRFTVTPEYPKGTYCYFISPDYPRISRHWRGEPDPSFFKRGPRAGFRHADH